MNNKFSQLLDTLPAAAVHEHWNTNQLPSKHQVLHVDLRKTSLKNSQTLC